MQFKGRDIRLTVIQRLCVLFLRGALPARQDRLQKRVEVCVPAADTGKLEWQQRTTFHSTGERGQLSLTIENRGAPGTKDDIS